MEIVFDPPVSRNQKILNLPRYELARNIIKFTEQYKKCSCPDEPIYVSRHMIANNGLNLFGW